MVLEGLSVLVRGIILGLAIAAPVGPIGLLCIRRTLEQGPVVGFATGLGAAVADTIFGAIAAFGVQVAINLLIGHQAAFRLIGGGFMLYVALRGFVARPSEAARAPAGAKANGLLGGFLTGLGMTITNPLTIFAFLAIFAGFGLSGDLGRIDAVTLVAGVFVGSALWWLILNSGVAAIRHRLNDSWFVTINRGAAVLLLVCGVYAVVSGVAAQGSWM